MLATQNPIEQEGTYPLPEAQVDRFMLKLAVSYPSKDEELEIMRRMAVGPEPEVTAVVEVDEILRARKAVELIYMDPQVEKYIVDLVFATRLPKDYGLGELADLIAFGRLAPRHDQPGEGSACPRVPQAGAATSPRRTCGRSGWTFCGTACY